MRVIDAAVTGSQRQVHARIVLRRKLRRHQLLGAAQHERADAPAQTSSRRRGVRRVLTGLRRASVQVTERAGGGEQTVRHNRQQCPQLHEVVLNGRAGHRDLGAGGHRAGDGPGAGAGVFDELRLVQQECAPAFGGGEFARGFVNGAAQRAGVAGVCILVHAQQRVAGQHQVRPRDALSQRGLTGGGFGNGHDLRLGQETCRLRRPVGDDGGRRNHEERRERLDALTAPGGIFGGGTMLLDCVGEQGESLHGLTQAHIVGENTAQTLLVQEGQPLETLHLVGA